MYSLKSTKSQPETPMSQMKRVSPCHNDNTRPGKRPKHLQVWYCYECWFGPQNLALDSSCVSCGNRRCSFSTGEWIRVDDIWNQEPYGLAALSTTTIHTPHSSSRAATPFDDSGSEISNIELTSLSSVPCLQQTHVLGTSNIAGTTQSGAPSQQTNKFSSEQWHVEDELVQVHVPEAIHDLLLSTGANISNDDARCRLSNGSPHLVPDMDADYSTHPTSETPGSDVGALHSIESHQVEHVAVTVDASAPNAEEQPIQRWAVPDGGSLDSLLPVWSTFPEDVALQFPADSKSLSTEPALPWVLDDTFPVSLQAQVPLNDYQPPKPLPSSVRTPDIPKPPNNQQITKDTSRNYQCCEPGGNQRFACLFYKHDPRLHIGCMSKRFTNIGHLRQHLNKIHKLGPNHCISCWEVFETPDKLTNHTTTARCIPRGGLPVDDLPSFPRTGTQSMQSDKKWYWGWKKLFGEVAAPPKCPFFHPLKDLETRFQAESANSFQSNCQGRDLGEGSENSSYVDHAEEVSFPMSPDWQFPAGNNLLGITEGITGLLSEDFSMGSS